jgi:hypothetical protein
MDHKSSSERLAEAMERTRRGWRTSTVTPTVEIPPISPPGLTIAISRESGTHATPVALAVGARLDWPVYDRELLLRIAEEMGLRTQLLEGLDEKSAGWLRECMEAFSSTPTVTQAGFVHHLVETLLSLSAHGNCVIVGRGAPQVLPPERTLRVRLVAPLNDRIASVGQRFGIPQAEAALRVAKVDYDRARFVKDYFQKDPADPAGYDLVLNSLRLPTEECAGLIVEALHALERVQAAR